MTAFVAVVALMVLAAVALLVYPLVGPAPATAKGEPVSPKAAPLAFALAVAVGLGAVALYSQINNFPWNNPSAAAPLPPGHEGLGTGGSMDEVAAALEARLQQEPNDFEGWRMLGRTYLVSGNAAKAASAYEKANSVSPQKDMALLLDLAEALVLTDDPAAQPRAKAIIDEALASDAGNQKALWYQGVMAVRAGDNETAKRNWTRLLADNPPPEIREVIASQLRELGVDVPAGTAGPAMAENSAAPPAGMGGAGAMGGGMGGEVAPKGRTVRISVKIDPSVAAKLKPGVPLFIAAREPGIPGPPIAATRISSDDLPATVVLSDANTMIAGRDLSSVNDVEIVARVAFGGTAVTASGDLIGRSVQKKGAAEELDVVINQVQP
ncbi:MAG: tetratricopeptide repeat protein [Steroidobacteraceae bacterium]